MKNNRAIELIAAVLICLFVYASLSKLLSYSTFVAQLNMHPMLKPFAGFFAWAIPVAESVIAILLFLPHTRLIGFKASLAIMTIFTLYITGMLLFNTHLPCSCGGVLQSLTWKQHLLFNLFFMLLAFVGGRLGKKTHLISWNAVHYPPP